MDHYHAWRPARRGAVAKNATQLRNGGGAGAESNIPSAGDFDSQRLRIDRHDELDIVSVCDERVRIPTDIRMRVGSSAGRTARKQNGHSLSNDSAYSSNPE